MDRRKRAIWPILRATYGAKAAPLWWTRWRIFFMACAELFGYSDGEEWLVGHCLFRRADRPTQAGEP
jgi:cyclopropane-fatty-acyl-phospholipid synthase